MRVKVSLNSLQLFAPLVNVKIITIISMHVFEMAWEKSGMGVVTVRSDIIGYSWGLIEH